MRTEMKDDDAFTTFEYDADDPADEARALLEAIGYDPATATDHDTAHAKAIVDAIHRHRGGP
jgi:hypothetical protein